MNNNITAVILAGGKSLRMGTDKAFVKFNNTTLIQNQVEFLSSIFKNVIISANAKYLENIKVIADIHKNIGPIGGIYSILKNVESEKIFILSVDTPFVSKFIVDTLIDNSKDFDISIPIINNKIEPTCAIYSKNCTTKIEEQITNKNYKLTNFITNCKTNYVHFNDDYLKFFLNINKPEDLINL